MAQVRRVPDFRNREKFSMVNVAEISYGVKVKDVIEFLQTCNPDAIMLGEYDGTVYAMGMPKCVHLKEVWDPCEYTAPSFFVEQTGFGEDEDLRDLEVEPLESTGVKWK